MGGFGWLVGVAGRGWGDVGWNGQGRSPLGLGAWLVGDLWEVLGVGSGVDSKWLIKERLLLRFGVDGGAKAVHFGPFVVWRLWLMWVMWVLGGT